MPRPTLNVGLLSLLQVLLLLDVSLFHLLSLLLMMLFDLLLPGVVGVLARHPLMILLLFLLEFLVLLVLSCDQLLLLLLVFPVELRIACIRRSRPVMRRDFPGVTVRPTVGIHSGVWRPIGSVS